MPFVAGLAAVVVAVVILWGAGGFGYYTTPLRVRAYAPQHKVLRPSGSTGHLLGICGTLLMIGTLAYVVRRRSRALQRAGSVKAWLEVHIFCGLVGPALVTFHTSFKFNGIIAVAFWSMVLVVGSGFVGRYLYVRIPRTMRGAEVDRRTLEDRAGDLKARLAQTTLPVPLLLAVEALERKIVPVSGRRPGVAGTLFGDAVVRWEVARVTRAIRRSPMSHELLEDACRLVAERALLLRRIATLEVTRKLFALWHVFHRPLVWVLFSVLVLHVAVAAYFGYTFFGLP